MSMRGVVVAGCILLHSGGVASAFHCRARGGAAVGALRASDNAVPVDPRPQAFATGYSAHPDLSRALEEATVAALGSLPPATSLQDSIDLAIVAASSLYDAPSTVVADVVRAVDSSSGRFGYSGGLKNLLGGTAGGVIGSVPATLDPADEEGAAAPRECRPAEAEATPAVVVTLALLPDVEVRGGPFTASLLLKLLLLLLVASGDSSVPRPPETSGSGTTEPASS